MVLPYGLFPRNFLKHRLISQNLVFYLKSRYPPPWGGRLSGWIVGNKPIFPGGLWEIRKTLRFENFGFKNFRPAAGGKF